jgi:putative flippase GtrA
MNNNSDSAPAPAGATRAAVNIYDFDDTIYEGDSSVDFFKFALRRNPLLLLCLPALFITAAKYFLNLATKEDFKGAYFAFVSHIPFEDYTTRFWTENISKIKPWYLAQKQDTDIIISASPDFLLHPIVRRELNLALIASPVDSRTGKFTGKNCRSEEKVRRLFEDFPDVKIGDFYSDSRSDAPLAQLARNAYFVEGDKLTPWDDYKMPLLKKFKKTYFSKDFLLFVFCGGAGTLTNFVCSTLFSLRLSDGYGPTLSYVLGYAPSLFVTYSLNAALIFSRRLSVVGFVKFAVSYIPNFLILFSLVALLLNYFHWHRILVYGIAGLFGIPLTFFLVKLFVFTGKKPPVS